MKNKSIVVVSLAVAFLAGCVSQERKAEYAAWQASDDGIRTVTLEEFEAEHQNGWRDRAEQKKKVRLAREKEAEELARRNAEYKRWLDSDDKVEGATLADFEKKYKDGWETRAENKKQARLAKEAAAQAEKERLATRTALFEKTVTNDLATIKKCYAKGGRYMNPFLGSRSSNSFLSTRRNNQNDKGDWLAKWASPRMNITEVDALAGEALLSAFGTKYLPNAYANYEKKRESLIELQQAFNEEFPQPWTIRTTNPKWNAFNKVLEKFVKARTEFFFCHDELCHYWLLNRFGVLVGKDFAAIDAPRLAVHLLPENVEQANYTLLQLNPMDGKLSDFALKYAPESNAIYQKMKREFTELDELLAEVFKQRIQMDDARYSRVLTVAVAKRNDLVREMNTLSLRLQAWYVEHRTTEKSSDDLAKYDAEMGRLLKAFIDALPSYIKDDTLGPVIANRDMVRIPEGNFFSMEGVRKGHYNRKGKWIEDDEWETKNIEHSIKRFRMQRTEVTQLQWMLVMGNNPSDFRGPDRPVENVSWDDCQEFIKRASQIDGIVYRLPSGKEWEYACRAGSTVELGKRMNGECGPLDAMGWYRMNNHGNRGTHAVALKEPNAFGLFDMHGNVSEWCQDNEGRYDRQCRGGDWRTYDFRGCSALWKHRSVQLHNRRRNEQGFRLVISQE